MTFGFTRDDAEGKFLPALPGGAACSQRNPFQTLDQDGVGQLIEIAASGWPRRDSPDIKLGICGEHGGDPELDRVLPRGPAWTT